MKIEYPTKWGELESFEISCKGWLQGVLVKTEKGANFELTFFDPTRLAQEIQDEHRSGKVGFIEKGLIVIPKVTKSNIEKAIVQAQTEGYFE